MQAQNGATALHNAAGGGFDAVVKALLAANADIDVQNTNCNTALHLAAGKGAAQYKTYMHPQSQDFFGRPPSLYALLSHRGPMHSGI